MRVENFLLLRASCDFGSRPERGARIVDGWFKIFVFLTLAVICASSDLEAEFVPSVVEIDLLGRRAPDPEFDSVEHQVTWQDDQNKLWVASIDPESGHVDISGATLLASNLAPMFPMEGSTVHGNGPEWLYSAEGSKILYTARSGVAGAAGWKVGVASKTLAGWEVGIPESLADVGGGIPEGTKVQDDTDPYFYSYSESQSKRKAVVWRKLYDSEDKGEISFETKSPPRWAAGEHFLITAQKIGPTTQAVLVHPEQSGAVEQLTFDKKYHKDELFMWRAPEFGNEHVFIAAESTSAKGEAKQIGVYRKVSGQWTRIKTISPPAGAKFRTPHSPEPFVFGGRSYALVSMASKKVAKDGVEIWIAGIGPDNFFRKIAGPEHGIRSTDAEPYVSDEKAFIFFSQYGGQQLFRADTGL